VRTGAATEAGAGTTEAGAGTTEAGAGTEATGAEVALARGEADVVRRAVRLSTAVVSVIGAMVARDMGVES
jgi:hypothetical protein